MRFPFLDGLEAAAGDEGFRLEAVVTRRVTPTLCDKVGCSRYCGFLGKPISNGNVTPLDCTECSGHRILSGTVRAASGRSWPVTEGRPQFATREISRAAGRRLRVVEIDFETDPRWQAFVTRHPDGLVYQRPAWLKALTSEYRQGVLTLACEDEEAALCGVMPLVYTRGLPFNVGSQQTGRRLSSLPRTPVCGPLAASDEAKIALLRAAVELTHADPGLQLQLKTDVELPEQDVPGLAKTAWRPSYILELPARPEDLRFGDARNRHNLKWAVNKAVKLGLQLRKADKVDELRAWYELYLHTMRDNAVPPRPYRFFEALWHCFVSDGVMELVLAEQTGASARLVAGSIFLRSNRTVHYVYTGCARKDLALHPNDLILWESIHQACRQHFRWFDFGEVPEEHPELVRFKTKWGAEPRPQYRYYSPEPRTSAVDESMIPSTSLPQRLWQHLPLRVTTRLGDWLYSYL